METHVLYAAAILAHLAAGLYAAANVPHMARLHRHATCAALTAIALSALLFVGLKASWTATGYGARLDRYTDLGFVLFNLSNAWAFILAIKCLTNKRGSVRGQQDGVS